MLQGQEAELKMRFLSQHGSNQESEHQRVQQGSDVLEMMPDSDGLDRSKGGMVNIAVEGCQVGCLEEHQKGE